MNKAAVGFILSVFLLLSTVAVSKAEEVETCVQVTQYGGGVGIVCGAKHEPVETGLADINPLVLASVFFMFSGYGLYEYKKLQKVQVRI